MKRYIAWTESNNLLVHLLGEYYGNSLNEVRIKAKEDAKRISFFPGTIRVIETPVRQP